MTTQRKKLDAGADRLIRHAQLGDTADVALRRLSQAANHGKLWFATAGGVALTGPRGRDAAIGGLVSLGAASAMANLILKPLVGGTRPDPQTLSSARRLKGQPLSRVRFHRGTPLRRPPSPPEHPFPGHFWPPF